MILPNFHKQTVASGIVPSLVTSCIEHTYEGISNLFTNKR